MILFIVCFIIVLTLLSIRTIRYELMIAYYKIYSLYGKKAWNNKYPIDYPYQRIDLIPTNYMLEFNHICYYRQITGNNRYKMKKMKSLVKNIESYCKANLEKQAPKQLTVLYPFTSKKDAKRMKIFIKNKYPFVIRGGNWKTSQVTIQSLIQKYGDTTVMFDKNNETFLGEFKDILVHKAYLSNSTSFMKKHPEILHQDDINILTKMTRMKHSISQIFLSLVPNNGTPMHSAFSHNFFFMIQGNKKWTLWHPDYLCLMYPYFPKNGIYFGSYTGIRDLTDTSISKHYPLLQYAPSYEIILQQGDILFNPGPWWHAIKNISLNSLAISTRWEYKDILPSCNQLQYCQILNPNIHKIFRKIYKNTGKFNFDVDENYQDNTELSSTSLIEKLNHDSLKRLTDTNRHQDWHGDLL